MSPIKLLLLRNQSYKQLEIMYFAQSIEEHRIEVFKILLFRTLDGYDGYRDEISKVVVDAIDLLRGKKSLYTIDKERYPLIVFLNEKGFVFLEDIEDPKNLSNKDYYNLLSVFESNLDFVWHDKFSVFKTTLLSISKSLENIKIQ